jgi:hypothetical protein
MPGRPHRQKFFVRKKIRNLFLAPEFFFARELSIQKNPGGRDFSASGRAEMYVAYGQSGFSSAGNARTL